MSAHKIQNAMLTLAFSPFPLRLSHPLDNRNCMQTNQSTPINHQNNIDQILPSFPSNMARYSSRHRVAQSQRSRFSSNHPLHKLQEVGAEVQFFIILAFLIQIVILFLNICLGWPYSLPLVLYSCLVLNSAAVISYNVNSFRLHLLLLRNDLGARLYYKFLGWTQFAIVCWFFIGLSHCGNIALLKNTPIWLFMRIRLVPNDYEFELRTAEFWGLSAICLLLAFFCSILHLFSGCLLLKMSNVRRAGGNMSNATPAEASTRLPLPPPSNVELAEINRKREIALTLLRKSLEQQPIPPVAASSSTDSTESAEEDLCLVCFEKYSEEDQRAKLVCECGVNAVGIHDSCLRRWLEESRNCPLCRSTVFLVEELLEEEETERVEVVVVSTLGVNENGGENGLFGMVEMTDSGESLAESMEEGRDANDESGNVEGRLPRI